MLEPRNLLLLILLSLFFPKTVLSEERTWKSATGHAVRGELVQFDGQNATLRRNDNKTIEVPIDRFSVEDRKYLLTVSNNADSRRIVLLENVHEDVDRFGPVVNMDIPREMVRQMILISARDEFGLATRDGTLRESAVAIDSPNVIRLRVLVAPGLENGLLRIRLWHLPNDTKGDNQQNLVWSEDYRYDLTTEAMYATVLYQLLTDAKKDISSVFTKLGCSKVAENRAEIVEPLTEATELLNHIDIASQYEAVRGAHRSIRTDGEHFENLSVLVRGYANLSLMTLHYWNSASQAFLARSLLYGERLENASKDQDRINAHRAYSMAIFGVHKMALDQLDHMSPDATQREFGTWFDVIRPYCEYDVDRLREIAVEHSEARQLATWLAYRASVEIGDERQLVESAQHALRDCPFLFQVHSELLTNGSMGVQRWVARNGPLRCQQYIQGRLDEVDDLPTAVQDEVAQRVEDAGPALYAAPGAIIKQLIAAGSNDRDEPSWELLGRMLQDELFAQMTIQLHDATNAVSMSLEPLVTGMLPHIADHPYAAYVESFGIEQQDNPQEFLQCLDRIQRVDPQLHMLHFYRKLWKVDTPKVSDIGKHFRDKARVEFTSHSLGLRILSGFPNREAQIMFANMLVRVSPNSPRAERLRVAAAVDATPEQLNEWAKASPDDAYIQELVASAYEKRGMFEKAIQGYQQAAKLNPNCQRYITLANVYRRMDDKDKWKSTLESYLKVPDDGLGHHRVQSEIAKGLIAEQKWNEALPYATAAAESWSSWGLRIASEVHEGLGNWDESERYIRALAESYERSRIRWYFWCRRTGRGDLAAARKLAQKYLQAPKDATNLSRLSREATFHQLEGDAAEAVKSYKAAIDVYKSLWLDIHLGILAKRSDQQDVLEEVVERLDARAKSRKLARSEFRMRLSDMARRALAPKENETLTLQELDAVLDGVPYGEMSVDLHYFVGEFARFAGHDEAIKYWRSAVETGPFDRHTCILAGHELAQLNKSR